MVSQEDFIKELQVVLAAYQAASFEDRERVMQILEKYISIDNAKK